MNRPVARVFRAATTAAVAAALALLALALRRSRANAREPPLSPITADWYVGPDFVDRAGLATGEEPAGEVADVAAFAGETFDPERLHPEVRRFYERAGEYAFRYRTRWYPPFRTGAALASRFTGRIEQLNLPGPGDPSWHRLESRFLDVDEPGAVGVRDGSVVPDDAAIVDDTADPAREDVRAWVRTDAETGEAVFVALYATHHRDGDGYVNISVPMPGGGVDTVLRPENYAFEGGTEDRTGVRLTTEGRGDPGLYLRTPLGPFEVPGGQEFRVWPAAETGENGDGHLRATHEMWLLGRTFLTVEYEIERA